MEDKIHDALNLLDDDLIGEDGFDAGDDFDDVE